MNGLVEIMMSFARNWWFDPFVASFSFGVATYIYWTEERKQGLSRQCRRDDVWNNGFGPVTKSLAAYWVGLYILRELKLLNPPNNGFIPDGLPVDGFDSLLYLLTEVISGIIAYDFYFFFIHWAFHELPFFQSFRAMHKQHHIQLKCTVEARDVLNHSLADGSLQVLINIYVQRYNPWGAVKSRLARAIHNVIVTWMLTESHTATPNLYVFRRWFIGVREHRLHHLGEHRGRYQQFFGYLDEAKERITPHICCMFKFS